MDAKGLHFNEFLTIIINLIRNAAEHLPSPEKETAL